MATNIGDFKSKTKDPFLQAAIHQAKLGSANYNGIPIGAALVIDGIVAGLGYNQRVQKGSPVFHAEMACLENAGRLKARDYQRATMYTTLSPCDMCSGAILLYRIPRVVIGENRTFRGPEDYLALRGVQLEVVDDPECYRLLQSFIHREPALWSEDIGQ